MLLVALLTLEAREASAQQAAVEVALKLVAHACRQGRSQTGQAFRMGHRE
jgi:hypothetical protein